MNQFRVVFYFSVLMLFASVKTFAQDTIVKRSNEIILGKVVEVGDTEINFRRQNNLNGPIYVIEISDVAVIKYGSGAKDIFNAFEMPKQTQQNQTLKEGVKQAPPRQTENPVQQQVEEQAQQKIENTQVEEPEVTPQIQNLYLLGQNDARKYYKKYKAASITTMISTTMSPLELGFTYGSIKAIVVTAICLSKPPKTSNLGIPTSSYMNDPKYLAGYKNGAYKKKRKKVMKNFLIPAAGWIGTILLLAAIF